MARRFVVSVELLTGLAIGAATAAAAAALMISVLVRRDLTAEAAHMAASTAALLSDAVDSPLDSETFEEAVAPLLAAGELRGAALFDAEGRLITGVGTTSPPEPGEGGGEGWSWSGPSGSGAVVGVLPPQPALGAVHGTLLGFLAAMTLVLGVLALYTPRYLERTVLEPLRGILAEADRFTPGGGGSAEEAGASFHRLVEMLGDRERRLGELMTEAERRADVLEKRSTAILAALGSAVVALDGSGAVTHSNRLAEELFRLDPAPCGALLPWDRTEEGRQLHRVLMELGESGGESSEFQTGSQGKGDEHIYAVKTSRSPSGETVVMVTDVTRIGELERRLAEQAAMADMGAAAAGISHEMGNTLCALSGFVDLLARGHADERTERILEEVRREVESARSMIDAFGLLSGSPEPDMAVVEGGEIELACRRACSVAGERCSFETGGGPFRVAADPRLLESCVRNLVRNAVEASPDCTVEVTLRSGPDGVRIEVSDNGPGLSMDPEEVFRPFRSTKVPGKGNMGLGLPVSRRIVRAMGGDLVLASSGPDGVRFIIWLPLPGEVHGNG